jgi:hypothetical protein
MEGIGPGSHSVHFSHQFSQIRISWNFVQKIIMKHNHTVHWVATYYHSKTLRLICDYQFFSILFKERPIPKELGQISSLGDLWTLIQMRLNKLRYFWVYRRFFPLKHSRSHRRFDPLIIASFVSTKANYHCKLSRIGFPVSNRILRVRDRF